MRLILATGSPYRREAFGFLGLDFEAEGSGVVEEFEGRPQDPGELVKELARRKAEDVASRHGEGIVIGFDSLGWFQGKVLEKPKDREEAFQRLKDLSGKGFRFLTGIHVMDISTGKSLSRVIITDIRMRNLQDQEIRRYLEQDPHFTTYAPGFDPLRNMSSSFASSIEGSYNNFIRGIPLEAIMEMLMEIGYNPEGGRV